MKMKQDIGIKTYILCEACQKPVNNFGTIKLGTYDPSRHYQTSHRKMISNYKWQLCPKHFKETLEKIKKAIEGI